MMSDTPVLEPAAAYALWAGDYPPYAHNPLMCAEERAMRTLLPRNLGGLRVLDAGCGSGRYLMHAQRRGAHQVVGVDLSTEMLARARAELRIQNEELRMSNSGSYRSQCSIFNSQFVQASLDSIPIRSGWADITICGLTLGHLEDLRAPLAELARVTRSGGRLLCSDFHPIGRELGWRREFSVSGQRYAVRHTWHLNSDWQRAADSLGLKIVSVLEPRLDPSDIPAGARFDPIALEAPAALVFELAIR
jgi:malonyl-CoA O-methyltransferase